MTSRPTRIVILGGCPPQKLSPHDLCQPSLSHIDFDHALPLLWSDGR